MFLDCIVRYSTSYVLVWYKYGFSLYACPYGHKWFECYSILTSIFESCLETSQRESGSIVQLQRHSKSYFSLRILESLLFLYWFKRVCVLLVYIQFPPRQSSLCYTHFSHSHFISMFTFLALVSSIEEGHICRPLFGRFFFSFCSYFLFPNGGVLGSMCFNQRRCQQMETCWLVRDDLFRRANCMRLVAKNVATLAQWWFGWKCL